MPPPAPDSTERSPVQPVRSVGLRLRVRSSRTAATAQWVILGIGLLALGGFIAGSLYSEHSAVAVAESERLANLAKVVDQNLSKRLESIYKTLGDLREAWTHRPGQEGARQLQALGDALQGVRTLTIIDAAGIVLASNRGELVGRDFSQRAYFMTARAGGDPQAMYVSPPYTTALGAYAINLVRVMADGRGRFAGIVAATLDPQYFSTLLDSVRYAPDLWTALAHGDGRQFMMVPERAGASGPDSAALASFFSLHADSGRSASVSSGGVAATGGESMTAVRSVGPPAARMDKPLLVAGGRELAAVFADWRRNLYRETALFGALAAAACASLYLYQRRQKTYGALVAAREAERRAAERELLASAARYQAVARSANDAVVSIDAEGRIVDWNPASERLFGYREAEVVGQPVELLIPAAYRQRHSEGLRRRVEDGAPPLAGKSVEVAGRRKDGGEFPLELSVAAWKSEQGSFFTGIMRDITERKRIERQIEDRKEHLEELVEQRTAELVRALEAAKLADRTKDAFLANMSHELRTPLSAVIGIANLAREASADARQRDYLDKIVSSGRHLNRIVDELLDLSKIAAGRMEFELAAFSLRALAEQSRSVMAHRAQEKGLRFEWTIDEAVPDVLVGDQSRILQILLNLLGNAIKFTSAGGVEVRTGVAAREAGRICIEFAVEDTGIGMPAADLERLFQPFSQADASVSRRYGGTGLGLTICRRLAEMMQGDISVVSREGEGSTFRVRLWLGLGDAADLPQPEAPAGEALPQRYRDVRVLVVEDQPLNREIVEALLTAVGIVPQMAQNGREALDVLDAAGPTAFDLVLMDVQMPVMDGLSATRALRGRSEFAGLPIIGMTAHTMAHERQIGADAGMNDHIGKPFDNASFYRTLAKWIARDKRQQAAAGAASVAPAEVAATVPGDIDTQGGLARFAGNEARYRHWLNKFVDEAATKVAELQGALAAGEAESARKSAHALKGQAGMLGLTGLYGRAAALDAALGRGEPVDALLADMQGEAQALRQRLGGALAALGQGPADPRRCAEATPPGRRSERRQRPRVSEKVVLLIDDDPAVLETLGLCLRERYPIRLAASGAEGLRLARMQPLPDLVLLDIELPDTTGYAVCSELKRDAATAEIPVVFLSSHTNVQDITGGLELGAVDYVSKPVELPILMARVQTHLRLRETSELLRHQNVDLETLVAERTRDLQAKTSELQRSQYLGIVALGSIAETRDSETGNHIYRTSAYVEVLAGRLATRSPYRESLGAEDWERIWKSAPLHDIGKVGIPDQILLKPGPLTDAEFAVMKRHTTLGRDAIRSAETRANEQGSFLRTASEIAYSHHERWDGGGYPEGIAGEAIPLSARLMAVADVYDALVSDRVYKAAIPHAAAVDIIRNASGSQFDPGIVACFVESAQELQRIATKFRDHA